MARSDKPLTIRWVPPELSEMVGTRGAPPTCSYMKLTRQLAINNRDNARHELRQLGDGQRQEEAGH